MRAMMRPLPRLSAGERRVALALGLVALFGALAAHDTVQRLGEGAVPHPARHLYEVWVAASGAIGAATATWLCRRSLGLPGLRGLARASVAILRITAWAPVIAGSLALPFYGTMFGPMALVVAFCRAPATGLLWAATLAAAHVMFAPWQRERDSIVLRPSAPAGVIPRGSSGST
jgi:hypothetical protein